MRPLFLLTLLSATPAFAGITYTCDPNVEAKHAGTCTYLNSTIAPLYTNTFSNVNASIYVVYGSTGLGSSLYGLTFTTYSSYVAGLTSASQASGNAAQAAAVKALNAVDTAVYGNFSVAITSALARALNLQGPGGIAPSGNFCLNPGTGACYDGIITITNDPSTVIFFRTGNEGSTAYDFYSIVEHETDEILGTSSCINTTNPLSNGCQSNTLAAVDLFRYQSAGNLVLISTTPGAYFSYDGGVTNGANGKIYNTLANGDDYSDFVSSNPCQSKQSVQDALGCPGFDGGLDITNDGGAEINILNALGYSLVGQKTPPPPAAPALTNVLNGATGQSTMAASTYVAIYGSNLSSDSKGRTWAAADFIAGPNNTLKMPTSLDGTTVTVNGLPAYVEYVSGTQLNIVTPASLAAGSSVPVVVSVNGTPSATFNIAVQNLAPSFFAWSPSTPDAGKYLIAQHLNGTNVGKVGLFPGTPANFTTPAKPNETIQLYGTGFGPTNPPIAAGIETDKTYNLSPTPTATVGGINANVVFAGLIQTLSQVYQFDITIPANAPNGDLPLVVNVNGVNSFSGLITVQGP